MYYDIISIITIGSITTYLLYLAFSVYLSDQDFQSNRIATNRCLRFNAQMRLMVIGIDICCLGKRILKGTDLVTDILCEKTSKRADTF